MYGIPNALYRPLRQALMDCVEFQTQGQIYAVFGHEKLKPFQNRLPEAGNVEQRVDLILSYLADKRRKDGENVLVLLLEILAGNRHKDDDQHDQLLDLARQLSWYKQLPLKHESPDQPSNLEILEEANPARAQMLAVGEAEIMLNCARAVAHIEIPRSIENRIKDSGTGTAWLIAPDLALTCWHVIKNRGYLDPPLTPSDLEIQVSNLLLTFDYLTDGRGIQYRVNQLVYPLLEADHELDYAVLRLEDRQDHPLQSRSYLRLDLDAPLTSLSNLYIIQHPLGRPQQAAGDNFVRVNEQRPARILYKTPTEPGTSGAPVFNRRNWRVVALHNGENDQYHLREGTLLREIMDEIKYQSPDLYTEIRAAQDAP